MDEQQQKRQIAYKVSIGNILSGEYVQEEGWNPNYVKINDVQVSRVNVYGVVIGHDGDQGNRSIRIDDGTGNISLRSFENSEQLDGLQIGNTLLVVGKPREFGNQRYIISEIVKKIEDPQWMVLRKLEISKTPQQEVVSSPVVEDAPIIADNGDLFSLIKELDMGEGVDFSTIIEKSTQPDVEKTLQHLITIGELFEIKPGKIKILE